MDMRILRYIWAQTFCAFVVEEFNYEGLCRALEQLSSFEKRANSRLIQSGVLKGLNVEEIKRAGEHLILQDGCKGFFQEIVKRENLNADIHVLSYCWCGDLIRSAFASSTVSEAYAYIIMHFSSMICVSVFCPFHVPAF